MMRSKNSKMGGESKLVDMKPGGGLLASLFKKKPTDIKPTTIDAKAPQTVIPQIKSTETT